MLGIRPIIVDHMVLEIDEAVSNVDVHSYQGRPEALEVTVRRQGDAVSIWVRDKASPFDPTSIPTPDLTAPLEQRVAGRMGIHLIRQVIHGKRD